MSVRYAQYMVADTAANLQPNAIKGDIGFAIDTGLFYGYSGTAWVSFGSMMGTLKGIQTSSSTPTTTLGSAAGTGATAVVTGTNVAGKIVLTTGASLLTSGKVMTLNFADSLAYANGCFINFTPGDANFANIYTKLYAITSTTGVDLYVATNLLSVATAYTGYYQIIGY